MGEWREDFSAEIQRAVLPLSGQLSPERIEVRESSGGKYLSLTLLLEAHSQEQLDAVYRTLTSHPWVKVVL
ncbi:MAG: DUF493 domain-containing protein [Betaproteobacteria bacterium]|nr:DUF493 domain-containing protein [Betaproteobacteria bacterium]NBT74972.1 DUF493 domain-containing protein [Betaproteobacteria bacterium]NBY14262.1 DUF493 domain-containing protein [Betaproteobacteria bacterium]NCA15703.1 DUF493 domain-containing protein [Betaproteobacteria bacterium]